MESSQVVRCGLFSAFDRPKNQHRPEYLLYASVLQRFEGMVKKSRRLELRELEQGQAKEEMHLRSVQLKRQKNVQWIQRVRGESLLAVGASRRRLDIQDQSVVAIENQLGSSTSAKCDRSHP